MKSFVWWMGVKGGLKATTLAGTSQTRKCQMQKKIGKERALIGQKHYPSPQQGYTLNNGK